MTPDNTTRRTYKRRRATDLSAINENYDIASLVANTSIGNRSTDNLLAHSFNKTDQSHTITSDETLIAPKALLISRTDQSGIITQCNDVFIAMSGWTKEELLGSNHNLVRHPEMPQLIFKLAWDHIKNNKEFYGYFKNIRKDGGFYWVFAYITADIDINGATIGYTSYRRFASQKTIQVIEPIYKILCKAEKNGGVAVSEPLLTQYLEKTGFGSYDKFIVDVQLEATPA